MGILKDIKKYLAQQQGLIELQKEELQKYKPTVDLGGFTVETQKGLDRTADTLDELTKIIERADIYKRAEDEAKRFTCKIETTRFSYVDEDSFPYDISWTCHGGLWCEKCKMRTVLQEMLTNSKFIKDGIKDKSVDLSEYSIVKK